MKKYLRKNSDAVVNAIRLKRTQLKTQVFVLVEGDTDKRLFKKFFAPSGTHIEIAHGKQNILEVLEKLRDDPKLIAIKDADFDRINYFVNPFPNLFLTDGHDIENMMLNSKALDALVSEHGSDSKMQSLHKPLIEILIHLGKPLGYLRLLNNARNLGLHFDNLNYKHFIDLSTPVLNIQTLIQDIKNKSQKHSLTEKTLIEDLEKLESSLHRDLDVCNGHDLSTILGLAFSKLIGSRTGANELKGEKIEEKLRLAYHFSDFKQTQLYKDLQTWGERKGLKIFIEP